ncbi:MAG: diadenylate cyclase CdaA [bacterium JZ-2024 1]
MTWNWVSLADFLIIWFFLYLFLRLFRYFPFFNLVLGIFLLLLVYFGARQFHLITVYWFLERFFPFIPLILVILLQPEIRKAMEQTFFSGRVPFFASPVTEEEKKTVVQEIMKAVRKMLQKGVGGLIVVEGSVSLEPLVRKGVVINGVVGEEILDSIFSPQSVLHDGAVIIRDGRILSAACTLPLSEREDIPVGWGLRHRAALGISETSDALAVVVSEDSRVVSLAHRGRLYYNLALPNLEKELLQRWK